MTTTTTNVQTSPSSNSNSSPSSSSPIDEDQTDQIQTEAESAQTPPQLSEDPEPEEDRLDNLGSPPKQVWRFILILNDPMDEYIKFLKLLRASTQV